MIQHPRSSPFWEVFGSPIWSNIAEIFTRGSTLANKDIVSKIFEGFKYLWKREESKFSTFGPTLTTLFLLKMGKIQKISNSAEKLQPSLQICQNEVFILSPLSGNNTITFCNIWKFLPGNRAGSQVKGVESKFNKNYFIHTIPG